MGEFMAGMIICLVMVFAVVGGVNTLSHFDMKRECEETHNVNHCERDLTYTPIYPEVTE